MQLTQYLTLAALLLSLPCAAQIYKHVDKNGNISYSDQPAAGAATVEVPKANTIPALEIPEPARAAETADDEEAAFKYTRVRILEPVNDSAIEHGPGNFNVVASVKPGLKEGHKLQFFVDGAAQGKPTTDRILQLRNVNRGTHTLQVKVIDENGSIVKSSTSNKVHVLRPSIAHPGLRR
ncbi:MAG: DUF4124 domain-containing protein [Pseudomonadales bacterium]